MTERRQSPGRRVTDKSPAFQLYTKDLLSDGNVLAMTLEQFGAYIKLLAICWNEYGLVDDLDRMARMLSLARAEFDQLWPAIAPCFYLKDGRWQQKRLDAERLKQRKFRHSRHLNGQKGGRPRKTTRLLVGSEMQTEPKATESFAFASSSAFAFKEQIQERARELMPSDRPDLSERAGRFLERYAELYPKLRRGARYLGKPTLDFQEALQLVAVWDDERLDKLATVFLTTDHEFAEKGSRSVAQFRSMASWCDGRLAEAGLV